MRRLRSMPAPERSWTRITGTDGIRESHLNIVEYFSIIKLDLCFGIVVGIG